MFVCFVKTLALSFVSKDSLSLGNLHIVGNFAIVNFTFVYYNHQVFEMPTSFVLLCKAVEVKYEWE